jgi:hypothetical protein
MVRPEANLTPEPGGQSRLALIAVVVICVALGVVFAVLPHLAWWPRMGGPRYFADNDDMLYLAIAARAFHGHSTILSDPSTISGAATIYDWIQFAPGIVMARMAGGDALAVNLAWRLIAGVTMSAAWLLIVSRFHRKPWLILALTVWILSDAGFFSARPLLKQLGVTVHWLTGDRGPVLEAMVGERTAEVLRGAPAVHREWRIITPALSHAYLILALWLWLRARDRPTFARLALSGLGYGILFYVYFYNWISMGLALLLACMVDRGHRRVALWTGVIGLLVGLPRIWERNQIRRATSSDWLIRSDLFRPIPRTFDLMFPKLAIVLLFLTSLWVWGRRRDLTPLWLLGVASLLLMNHQLVTGLQIQNSHWMNVLGSSLSLLVVLFAGERLERTSSRLGIGFVIAGCVIYAALGLGLRWVEGTQSADTLMLASQFERYREQRLSAGAPRLEPLQMTAGEQAFLDFVTIAENERPLIHYAVRLSPSVDDRELFDRIALNEYLRGAARENFAQATREYLSTMPWGPWARDASAREARLEESLAAFDRVSAEPEEALIRFKVRYLALMMGKSPPPTKGGWKLLQNGPTWDVWERPDLGASPR